MPQSLVNAIYERYSEISSNELDANVTTAPILTNNLCADLCSVNCIDLLSSSASSCSSFLSPNSSPNESSQPQFHSPATTSGISFYIPPAYSPRKTQSGLIMTSVSLVMSDQSINSIGDCDELSKSCQNVLELDLAKNDLNDWNEVKNLLNALKRLRLLNLSHNPLCSTNTSMNNDHQEENVEQTISYFNIEWTLAAECNIYHQLKILILNSCHIDLRILECLLDRLPNLSELHLASNNYSTVNFSDNFVKYSIKILYFNNNNISNWNEVCKLGRCFPNLENLVLSHNNLANFCSIDELQTTKCFQNLEILILNKLKINEWSVIDQLREFPHLKHVRIQNIPLLNSYNDEEKYYLLVAHLDESIDSLNGSKITDDDKENCERKYIRHYLDVAQKPPLYYELESKHGKLNKLADVSLEGNKRVHVTIKFRDEPIYERIDVRQTVGEFKKQLEKKIGYPSAKFRVFYIDIEACSMSIYGPEELKHPNRCLYSFNIRDGDEFEVDLKPPSVVHSSEQSLLTCYSNNQLSRPLNIRNRKISDSQNITNNTIATSSGTINSTSRLSKKTRSGLTNLSNSTTEPKSEIKMKKTSFFQSKRVQKKEQEEVTNENVAFSYDETTDTSQVQSQLDVNE